MTATSLNSSQGAGRAGDKIFSGAALAAGCLILAVLFGVALFLVVQAIPALTAPAAEIQGGEGFFAYIWPIVIGTLIAAVIALVIATPIAIGVALFISHFAPRELAVRPGLRGRPAGRHPVRGLRRLGCRVPRQGNLAGLQLAGGQHGLAAHLPGPGLRHRQDHPDRRHRAVRDGPAHHHVPEPRNLPADPQAARGSGPGPRRHALGNDQDGGPALRPPGHHQRRHARPGPRPRRNHGRGPGAVLRRPDRQPDHRPATRPSPPKSH